MSYEHAAYILAPPDSMQLGVVLFEEKQIFNQFENDLYVDVNC